MAEQPDEAIENTDEGKPESKGKMAVFAVALVPLITALSFFLVVKVINPRFAPSASAETVDEPGVAGTVDATDSEGFLYELGTVLVNPAGGRSIRIMKVGVSIEVMTKDLIEKAEKLRMKLQHQLIVTLSSKQIEELASSAGKIALQEELKEVFSSELGAAPGEIRQVYFTEFIIQ
jgi:flagellar basal body-associated protein FliL